MIIKHKKGMEMSIPVIVGAVIAMIVLVIIGITFFPKFFTLGGEISKTILSFNDTDKDKVPDFQDKCPCTAALIQSKLLPGCKKDTTEADALKDIELFSSKDCKKEEASSTSSSASIPAMKLKLSDDSGKDILVSGYETTSSKIYYEYSCDDCSVSITGVKSGKLNPGSGMYQLSDKGEYILTLVEKGNEIETHTIIKK